MRPSFLFAQSCFASLLLLNACSKDPEVRPPPPLPTAPAPVAPPDPTGETDTPAPVEGANARAPVEPAPSPAAPVPAKKGASLYEIEPKAKVPPEPVKPDGAKRQPANAGEPYEPGTDPKTVLAEPVAPPPKPFVAPTSAHVSLELPGGLKGDLARDTRMGPWLSRGVAAANRCYEKEAAAKPGLTGAITVGLVMHENDVPSAEIKSLDPSLTGVFSCLTSAMMSVRMPLFTGKEGQKYTATVRFSP